MDTVTIGGKEVPVSDLIAGYTDAARLKSENASLSAAQEAANEELRRASAAMQAIERAKDDPAFARQLADTLAATHKDSAYFKDQAPATTGTATPPEGTPPVTPTSGTQIPAPSVAPVELELARKVEDLQRQINADRANASLKERLDAISAQFPSLDTDDLLKRALEANVPIEHLHLVAGDVERERLQKVITEQKANNILLDGLLSGGGGSNVDENLAGIGSSLSAAQVKGDAEVDYASLDTGDALALAFAQVGGGNSAL